LLERVTGLRISKTKGAVISEGLGKEIDERLHEDISNFWDGKEVTVEAEAPERLYVSTDGTHVLTKEGWKEVKVGAIFTTSVKTEVDEEPVREMTRYVGSFESSEEFGKRLWVEAYREGIKEAKEVVMIGDGAKWIWNEAEMHFPEATQIVDWYHVSERIWDIGKSLYGEDTEETKDWVKDQLNKLLAFEGAVEEVIDVLRRLKSGRGKEIKEKITQAIGYLQNNRDRMNYKEFRDKGYFIGSGVVESSCKHLVAARLKRSGVRCPGNSTVADFSSK